MRWNKVIGLCLVMLAACLSACRSPLTPDQPQAPSLTIGIEFPQTDQPVKATPELEASALENKIHRLQLWVFRSDNHSLVGYLDLSSESDFPTGGGVRWYTLENISWEFVNEHPNVDVFVLANPASVGLSLDGNATYTAVNGATFGMEGNDDYFGFTNPVRVTGASNELPDGLPMSGKGADMELYGSTPQLKVDAVKIQRAVSRLRMVFCKTKTQGEEPGEEPDEVSIESIVFYEEQFPLKEYVFTMGTTGIVLDQSPVSSNYVQEQVILAGPGSNVNEHEVPENLLYVNQDPKAYQEMLDQEAAAGTVTDMGYYYLRESDQRLMGRINYTVNGKSRFREFVMSSRGDFARNHTWTLFAYFMSGRNLQLSLVVLPWNKSDYNVNFSDQIVTVTSKFTVDDTSADITHESGAEYYEVKLIPGYPAKCHLYITTPVGGTLMIYPQGAATLFDVSPEQATIDPSLNAGRIDIEVRPKASMDIDISDLPASETNITLSFLVEINGREINIDSEAVDSKYRFHL